MSKKIYKFYKTKKNNSLNKNKKYKIQNGGGPKMYQIPSGPSVKKKSTFKQGLATTASSAYVGLKELAKTVAFIPIWAPFTRKGMASFEMSYSNDFGLKNILKNMILKKNKNTPYTSN